jgi:DNA-binding beta-propeller fold protein YncE
METAMDEQNLIRLRGAKDRMGSKGLVGVLALGMVMAVLGLWTPAAAAPPDLQLQLLLPQNSAQFVYYTMLPQAVKVDGAGNVYVTDLFFDRLMKFDSGGNLLAAWGSYGTGEGQFGMPGGLALDGQGHVYVTDTGNSCIRRFDPSGNLDANWGSGISNIYPYGVAVDPGGNVYVVSQFEVTNFCIRKFSASGVQLATWTQYQPGNGQFYLTTGLASRGGKLYVVDTRVLVFNLPGSAPMGAYLNLLLH